MTLPRNVFRRGVALYFAPAFLRDLERSWGARRCGGR